MAYFEQTRITDAAGNVINPAQQQPLFNRDPPDDFTVDAVSAPAVRTLAGTVDDQIILLRRIAKLMESQGAVDPQNRQRMALDSISAGVTLPTVTTVTTVTTVSAVTAITNALPAGTNTIGNIGTLNGWNQQMFADWARQSYNSGIRANLSFS